MILIGIIYGALTGNFKAVTEAAVSSGKDAVTLCISMAGIVAMWSGLMKIAQESGMVEKLSGKMRPVIRFLFPRLPLESDACTNGLGVELMGKPSGITAPETWLTEVIRDNPAGQEEQMTPFILVRRLRDVG